MTDHRSIRDELNFFGKIEELYEVKTFTGYRKNKSVTVRILDLGSDCENPLIRFMCEVEQEDGKKATGNNRQSVRDAIAGVHWTDLD